MRNEDVPRPDQETVEIPVAVYRSLILQKLHAEIKAKRAAFEMIQQTAVEDFTEMGYWKMGYWKMKYWKMGHLAQIGDDVVNPADAPQPPQIDADPPGGTG